MFLNETSDLRKVMGVGIAITRGSAAAMSLAFSLLLLTVSRNVITRLRDTFLYHYIPFDSAVNFHKIIAVTGGIFGKGRDIFQISSLQQKIFSVSLSSGIGASIIYSVILHSHHPHRRAHHQLLPRHHSTGRAFALSLPGDEFRTYAAVILLLGL